MSSLDFLIAKSGGKSFTLIMLQVRWDDVEVNRHGRVSPWEIEPTGSFPSPSSMMASGLKRSRIGLPLTKPDFPIPSMSIHQEQSFSAHIDSSFVFLIYPLI